MNGYGGNDWPMMRYADVILMLAEVNMYQGNTAAARFATLKLAILHERRSELAFEHHRWFDLLRFRVHFESNENVSERWLLMLFCGFLSRMRAHPAFFIGLMAVFR